MGNISYPRTGAQKMYNIDDEHKWGKLVDRRMGCEFEGETLGDEFKGYVFKVTGGTGNDGFPMKQGILVKGRVRLILEPESHGFVCRKKGAHRRKAVRGCIIGTDMSCISLLILKKGEAELEGLTDENRPRRLGPKRANKIRKMFTLPKHSDNLNKKRKTFQRLTSITGMLPDTLSEDKPKKFMARPSSKSQKFKDWLPHIELEGREFSELPELRELRREWTLTKTTSVNSRE